MRAWVNLIGRRSLMVRLARIVGSCSYVRSIFVRFGSNRGIKGGMLLSKRFLAFGFEGELIAWTGILTKL